MTVPTTSWDETAPAGTRKINLGDNDIREMKTQIREVIGVDHQFPSSGSAADTGYHNWVTLKEKSDLGTGAEGATILGSQTVSGKGELVYTDEDDNDVQITSGGKLGSASINILGNDCDLDGSLISDGIGIDTNNTYITSKDAAGTGTVDLIKADGSDVVVLADGVQTATAADPANDKDLTIKNYVDDRVVVASGTAAHGATISLPSVPSGRVTGDYTWTVTVSINAIGTYSGGDGDNLQQINCSVDGSRVVTCNARQRDGDTVTGTANYFIIGLLT